MIHCEFNKFVLLIAFVVMYVLDDCLDSYFTYYGFNVSPTPTQMQMNLEDVLDDLCAYFNLI